MSRRAGCVLGWATAALVVAGCSGETEREDRPGTAHTDASSRSRAVERPSEATGRPAPVKGEPGFDGLKKCFGRPATILGTHSADRIVGTGRTDVILTFGGNDRVGGLRQDDRVCTGPGDDTVTDADNWQVVIDLGAEATGW